MESSRREAVQATGERSPEEPRRGLTLQGEERGQSASPGGTSPAHTFETRVSVERALRVCSCRFCVGRARRACCHREDAERSEADDAISLFWSGLFRPILPCRPGLAMTSRGGSCGRPGLGGAPRLPVWEIAFS